MTTPKRCSVLSFVYTCLCGTKIRTNKGKKQREDRNCKQMIQLISADVTITIIDEVNVESLTTWTKVK